MLAFVKRDRERVLQVRVTEDELTMAKALAEEEGLTVSDLLRQYIRKSHAKKLGGKEALEGATTKGGKR